MSLITRPLFRRFGHCIFNITRSKEQIKHINKKVWPIQKRPISTVDDNDVKHFSSFADDWWNPNGMAHILHLFVPLRVQFLIDNLINIGHKIQNPNSPLQGIRIADIGCAGGLLTEGLAKAGAEVTGIDASKDLINIAKDHVKLDSNMFDKVNYIQTTVEEFSKTNKESYDVVVASEILEHVLNPEFFLKECIKIIKPGGSILITTPNKTIISWFCGIILPENVFNIIPSGTHDWNKFFPPHEVQSMLEKYECKTKLVRGIMYNPLTHKGSWASTADLHYALYAIKSKD